MSKSGERIVDHECCRRTASDQPGDLGADCSDHAAAACERARAARDLLDGLGARARRAAAKNLIHKEALDALDALITTEPCATICRWALETLRVVLDDDDPSTAPPTIPASLAQLLDALPCPAYAFRRDGDEDHPIYVNAAARHHGRQAPAFSPAPSRTSSTLERVVFDDHGIDVLIRRDDRALSFDVDSLAAWARAGRLTRRQTQVAIGVTEGLSDKQIARRLGLAHHTVRTYVQQIYGKVGVGSRVALIQSMTRALVTGELPEPPLPKAGRPKRPQKRKVDSVAHSKD